MPYDVKEAFRGARRCRVIVKTTANCYIVETEGGEKVNIETKLPDVQAGHTGFLITYDGQLVFVRQPYM